MTADYPTDTAPATAEYVYHLLFQTIAIQSPWAAVPVPFETLADERADRLLGPSTIDIEFRLDEVYGIVLSPEELAQLNPLWRRTVREVCEFLAARITRPAIRPWRHVAGDCLPAGAFLTVRSILAARGANPDQITPSTPLAPFVRRHGESLLPALARLAPDRLPALKEPFPLLGFLLVILAPLPIFFHVWLMKQGINVPDAQFLASVFGGFVCSMTGIALMIRELWHPRLGNLYTFRDLAYLLAGQQPRRRIQPTH
jgi:hypothetical protein